MDEPKNYHTKWSKSYREIQISYQITNMWKIKKKMIQKNLQNRNRFKDFKTKKKVTKGSMCWGELNYELGINIYTLLYTK